MSHRLLVGDAAERLLELDAGSARCCVTSPPYWGLRDYGVDGQIGLEEDPEIYVERLVAVFREVRRVLAADGTLWLNLGDSYASSAGSHRAYRPHLGNPEDFNPPARFPPPAGLKPKDLVGIPWMVAFALRADGWYLRTDIVWHKPNPMPESIRDRPTRAHEFVFLLSKARRYFYDDQAVREPAVVGNHPRTVLDNGCKAVPPGASPHRGLRTIDRDTRNRRDVWTVAPKPFPGAHFAVMPPGLVEPCVLAGSEEGDVVLDPFAGACTVGMVARRLRRRFVGVELNPEYAELGARRIEDDAPLFNRERT